MSFEINRTNGIPYYIQVRDALQDHFRARTWNPGDRLPGEPELCRMFAVSRTVIRQALSDLASRGLIVREKGKGTFVAQPKIQESLVQKLTGFYQNMVEQGLTPVTQVLKQQIIPANARVASRLHLEPDTPVIEIERLRFVDDEPLQLVTSFLPYELCPSLAHEDLTHQSLYAYLEKHCGLMIARGIRSIEAVPANEHESRLLRVKRGAPLIMLDSVSFIADGTPVEYYHAVHRGDRTRFEVQLLRVRGSGEGSDSSANQFDDLPPSGGFVLRP